MIALAEATDAAARLRYARNSYDVHLTVCPANRRGQTCQKCLILEAEEIAAERALEDAS